MQTKPKIRILNSKTPNVDSQRVQRFTEQCCDSYCSLNCHVSCYHTCNANPFHLRSLMITKCNDCLLFQVYKLWKVFGDHAHYVELSVGNDSL